MLKLENDAVLPEPSTTLSVLIARYGRGPTLLALLRALWREIPKAAQPDRRPIGRVEHLNARMRADIGLVAPYDEEERYERMRERRIGPYGLNSDDRWSL